MSNIVESPAHYTQGKIEVIEFIEDQNLPFHLANVVKYICRAGIKNPETELEDYKKARWYLDRAIELLDADREGRAPRKPKDMKRPEVTSAGPKSYEDAMQTKKVPRGVFGDV